MFRVRLQSASGRVVEKLVSATSSTRAITKAMKSVDQDAGFLPLCVLEA